MRQRDRWTSTVAAAVALVVLTGCFGGGSNSQPTPRQVLTQTPASSASTAAPAGSPATPRNLKGTWQAVTVMGQPVVNVVNFAGKLVVNYPGKLSFYVHRSTITWNGSDGCNAMWGLVHLGPGSAFTTSGGYSTLILCPNHAKSLPLLDAVLEQAARARLRDVRLTLYDDSGSPLATFVRKRHEAMDCRQNMRLGVSVDSPRNKTSPIKRIPLMNRRTSEMIVGDVLTLHGSGNCFTTLKEAGQTPGVLRQTGNKQYKALRPGTATIYVLIPMCAGVEDKHCLGGVDVLARVRVTVK